MPIYEYHCEQCGKGFDVLLDDTEPTYPCPDCGEDAKKVFSPAGLHFKGDGWPDKERNQGKPKTVLEGKKRIHEMIVGRDHTKESSEIDKVKSDMKQQGKR